MTTKIFVTKTFLPPQKEYNKILSKSWDKQWITNRGELVNELEEKIQKKLSSPYITLTANGTLPLQIAIKALNLTGEIITTSFSYIATTSSIAWENCKPIFVDINKDTFNIDPHKIEAKITTKTSAIIATHVFGNPCDMEQINNIARKYNLRVIYDAAHCFGVEYNKKSIFSYGDVSTCSFHATKIFHTAEGGAMFTKNLNLHKKLFSHHNFGHNGKEDFHGLGINAKLSELQAAMGLAILPYFDKILQKRKQDYQLYKQLLNNKVTFQQISKNTSTYNFSYLPIVFDTEEILLRIISKLNTNNIYPRRYFYPCLNNIEYLNSNQATPVAESISKCILCLPLYFDLTDSQIKKISTIILQNI